MVLLLDTAALPPGDRDDALSAIFSAASGPTRVTHAGPDQHIRNKTESWNVGDHNTIIRTADTDLRLSRSPASLRASGRELFAVTYQNVGTSVYLNGDDITVQKPGELLFQDIAQSYEFAFDGPGDNFSFLMSYDDIGMPIADAVRAGRHLRSSPLYELVQQDFATLGTAAAALAPDSDASAFLAHATIEMTRALLASADTTPRAARDVLHQTLPTTIAAHARQHRTAPELSAARIAAMVGISAPDAHRVVAERDDPAPDSR
ncbi:hypothetical protein [Curtobacterium sp. ISL-83]|uniref:hypothetical protein n=1 Tax=Curtobacterium sp. ISL-83 TaxID=2819145 RepID=UPI001BED21C4|nr:hypothetical protein [Curtobacterium sp. ISL-83]MBT2501030.1 hypothetical protein [Curtobacterium sp. ISL-83]